MSKKNFTGGLNSLLGDQPEIPKRGRPVTQTKEITKSSQEGYWSPSFRLFSAMSIGLPILWLFILPCFIQALIV